MPDPLKIIITDDHKIFRSGVRISLQSREDIEIIGEAIHGQDLLDQLVLLKPDMILMGISMPVMDGLTALPELRKRHPHIKVIILSLHNDSSIICQALERGATTYLTKECGAEKIYETILACRNKWFYINDIVCNAIIKKKERNNPPINMPANMELKEKEFEILKLLCAEKTVYEIADEVNLSPRTVDVIIEKLKSKAGKTSLAALIEYCRQNKIIEGCPDKIN